MNRNTYFILGALVLGLGFLGTLIFSRQGQPTSFERELISLAESIGIDKDKFFNDYQKEDVRSKVDQDIAYGESLGVNSTPSAFVNGGKIDTTADYSTFKEIIQREVDSASDLPIKLEIFEDYQCPFCANFFPIPYLAEAEFGQDITVEHYHFPLENIHPLARRYAYAAEAARQQGKYFEMSQAIYTNESGNDYESLNSLITIEPKDQGSVDESIPSEVENENKKMENTADNQ